jgi:hypothetical protein
MTANAMGCNLCRAVLLRAKLVGRGTMRGIVEGQLGKPDRIELETS